MIGSSLWPLANLSANAKSMGLDSTPDTDEVVRREIGVEAARCASEEFASRSVVAGAFSPVSLRMTRRLGLGFFTSFEVRIRF